MLTRKILLFCALTLTGTSVFAETFGLLAGRTADPAQLSILSAEGGFVAIGRVNVFGVRVNYQLNDQLTIYGDLGLSKFDGLGGTPDGASFGVGAFYALPGVIEGFDLAVRGSFHSAKLGSGSFDATYSEFSGEAIISGLEPISDSGLNWYGSIGLNIFKFSFPNTTFGGGSSSDTDISFGAGVVLPTGTGQFYAGLEFLDDIAIGGGFRYFIN